MGKLFGGQTPIIHNNPETKEKYAKKPWVALVLSLFIPGLGHLYVGKRKAFSVLMVVGGLLSIIASFLQPEVKWISPYNNSKANALYNIAIILIIVAFAWDAYQEAKTTKIA